MQVALSIRCRRDTGLLDFLGIQKLLLREALLVLHDIHT